MDSSNGNWRWLWGLSSVLTCMSIAIAPRYNAIAQIIPDDTLGNESSVVTPNATIQGLPADLIEGGASRGAALFHSFLEFNVGEGQRVYFANPTGIDNIFSRVTGKDVSDILGTLGVNGGANLFFLNPNGIIFGENAQLDVRGSFVATTANSLVFENGFEFSAENPEAPPLLTVNVTPGLQYGLNPPGTISNAGNLAVGTGQTLTLYGNTVTSTGSLIAPGGTVKILGDRVGLFENAHIDVSSETGGGTILIGGDFQGKGTVPNAAQTFIGSNASINADAIGTGNGGRVIVWSDKATRFYGNISACGGANSGDGGFVEVSGKQFLDFDGLVNTLAPNGTIGTLLLDPTNIVVVPATNAETSNLRNVDNFDDPDIGADGDTKISSFAFWFANSNVILQARNNITFNADISMLNRGVGLTAQAGNDLAVNNVIRTSGGGVRLNADGDISVANSILTSGGEIQVQAGGEIAFTNPLAGISTRGANVGLNAGSNISVANPISTSGGAVRLDAKSNISVTDSISTLGGAVQLKAEGNISLTNPWTAILTRGATVNLNAGGKLSLTNGASVVTSALTAGDNSGDIQIQTGSLYMMEGAQLTSENFFGVGNPGNISIQASGTVSLSGQSTGILSSVYPGTEGNGGNIEINARSLSLTDGAQVTTILFRQQYGIPGGQGKAGNIQIKASDSVTISGTSSDGFSSGLFASSERGASGSAGTINVTTGAFHISDGALVNTLTANSGDAGNVTINATTFEAIGGGQILTLSSNSGDAGNIIINATDSITLSGSDPNFYDRLATFGSDVVYNQDSASSLITDANWGSTGNGGSLLLNTNKLTITDGALVSASTWGTGGGGNLTIGNFEQTSQLVEVSSDSHLIADVGAQAESNGGDLSIDARRLVVQDGSVIATSTLGAGKAGDLRIINADSVEVTGDSKIYARSHQTATGDGGDLTIDTGQLWVQNGSQVATSTQGAGQAGNLAIRASDSVQVSNNSILSASVGEGATGNGGNLTIDTGQLLVQDGAEVSTSTTGSGEAGNLTIRASDLVEVNRNSLLDATVDETATGNGGNLTIDTEQLLIQNNSLVSASTEGAGQAGNLTIWASDSVRISGSLITALVSSTATGDGGDVAIDTRQLIVQDDSAVTSSTFGTGDAGDLSIRAFDLVQLNDGLLSAGVNETAIGNGGDITLETRQLRLWDNGFISVSTSGEGQGGRLAITASDSVDVIGGGILADTTASQPAGDIAIATRQLRVRDHGVISTSTQGAGDGGNLMIRASDSVEVSNSDISAGVLEGTGNSGDLTIETQQLTVRDGGQINTGTFDQGNAGTLIIRASDFVKLTGSSADGMPSGLFASSQGSGNGGNLVITTGELSIEDGSGVSVSGFGSGNPGNLEVEARSVFLNQGHIAATTASGSGANIQLQLSDNLLMRNQSSITAEAKNNGSGGNIGITADFIIAVPVENSDIIANAFEGPGGNINITTQGLFGIKFRNALTPLSDINASSKFGVDGVVTINQPGIDPSRGLAPLPTNLVDPTQLIDRHCSAGRTNQQNSFTVTGRGGMPPSPADPLDSNAVVSNWVSLDSDDNSQPEPAATGSTPPQPKSIVEAQGWVINPDGQVQLIAQSPTVTLDNKPPIPMECSGVR